MSLTWVKITTNSISVVERDGRWAPEREKKNTPMDLVSYKDNPQDSELRTTKLWGLMQIYQMMEHENATWPEMLI